MARPDSTTSVALQGDLQSGAVWRAVITQILISAVLAGFAALGAFFIALSFHPMQVPNQSVFAPLGGVLLGICCLGFYHTVVRPWVGGVAFFQVKDETLYYRTVVTSKFVGGLSLASTASVTDHLPAKPFSKADSWVAIRFNSGESLKLHPGMLANADGLIEMCREACRLRVPALSPDVATSISLEEPRFAELRAELAEGERVLWVGRPAIAKYRSEMAASFVFGAMLTCAMLAALIFVAPRAWQDLGFGAIFGILVMLGFLTFGVALLWSPWRYRRLFDETIYCVTDRRAMTVRGYYWSERMHPVRTETTVESYDRPTAGRYQLDQNGRDIVFEIERHPRRRRRRHGSYVKNFGFLCVDDLHGAEAALARLRVEEVRPAV